jgi:hypothetical protein
MQPDIKKWRFDKRIISLHAWGLKLSAQIQKDLEERDWTTLTVTLANRNDGRYLVVCQGGVNDIPVTFPPQGKRGIKIHSKSMAEWLASELRVQLYRLVGSEWISKTQKWSAEWDGNRLVANIADTKEEGD